jgi:hypothetical protein
MDMTLIEMSKLVKDPHISGVLETLYLEENFFQYIPFDTIAGLTVSYTSEKKLPDVSFRKLNEAFSVSHGVVQRNIEVLRPFGGDSDTDKLLVDAYGPTWRAQMDVMWLKAMAIRFIQAFIYGNFALAGAAYVDEDGFDGLAQRITSGQTVDALGTGGADGSSVFAIRFGDGYCKGLMTGGGIDQRDLGETDAKPVYRTRTDAAMGLAIYNGTSVARMKDLRATTQVVTLDYMDELRDLISGDPTLFLMSKRSRRQLGKAAKTSGVALGMTIDQLGNPILSYGGIPIVVSDAVINTETCSS